MKLKNDGKCIKSFEANSGPAVQPTNIVNTASKMYPYGYILHQQGNPPAAKIWSKPLATALKSHKTMGTWCVAAFSHLQHFNAPRSNDDTLAHMARLVMNCADLSPGKNVQRSRKEVSFDWKQ